MLQATLSVIQRRQKFLFFATILFGRIPPMLNRCKFWTLKQQPLAFRCLRYYWCCWWMYRHHTFFWCYFYAMASFFFFFQFNSATILTVASAQLLWWWTFMFPGCLANHTSETKESALYGFIVGGCTRYLFVCLFHPRLYTLSFFEFIFFQIFWRIDIFW